MEVLPRELVFDLAEQMDIASLKQFMATNKDLYKIINSCERSISVAKISGFTLPPIGNMLSSTTINRHVLKPSTFHQVAELERREYRIGHLLLRSTSFLDIASPPGIPVLTVEQQDRLAGFLWRALYHCDRIADIAANEPCEQIPQESYDQITNNVWAMSPDLLPENLRGRDPFANPTARSGQIEYIRALPALDAAILYFLLVAFGTAFSYKRGAYDTSDPAALERGTVFEECILRHGTYFLWSYVHDLGEMKEMTKCMLDAGLVELTDWETGKPDVQPGLRMTLVDHFKEVCIDEDDDDGRTFATLRMFELVRDVVCGREKDGKKDEEGAETDEDVETMRDIESDKDVEMTGNGEILEEV